MSPRKLGQIGIRHAIHSITCGAGSQACGRRFLGHVWSGSLTWHRPDDSVSAGSFSHPVFCKESVDSATCARQSLWLSVLCFSAHFWVSFVTWWPSLCHQGSCDSLEADAMHILQGTELPSAPVEYPLSTCSQQGELHVTQLPLRFKHQPTAYGKEWDFDPSQWKEHTYVWWSVIEYLMLLLALVVFIPLNWSCHLYFIGIKLTFLILQYPSSVSMYKPDFSSRTTRYLSPHREAGVWKGFCQVLVFRVKIYTQIIPHKLSLLTVLTVSHW